MAIVATTDNQSFLVTENSTTKQLKQLWEQLLTNQTHSHDLKATVVDLYLPLKETVKNKSLENNMS